MGQVGAIATRKTQSGVLFGGLPIFSHIASPYMTNFNPSACQQAWTVRSGGKRPEDRVSSSKLTVRCRPPLLRVVTPLLRRMWKAYQDFPTLYYSCCTQNMYCDFVTTKTKTLASFPVFLDTTWSGMAALPSPRLCHRIGPVCK
jgi:hypothetical protein